MRRWQLVKIFKRLISVCFFSHRNSLFDVLWKTRAAKSNRSFSDVANRKERPAAAVCSLFFVRFFLCVTESLFFHLPNDWNFTINYDGKWERARDKKNELHKNWVKKSAQMQKCHFTRVTRWAEMSKYTSKT